MLPARRVRVRGASMVLGRLSLGSLGLVLSLVGCGAKTGIRVPEAPRDAGFDARVGAARDAGVDVPVDVPDAPRDVFFPPDLPRDTPPDAPIFVPPPDVCIELPPREPPEFLDVRFRTGLDTADVYFLVDVTGSMGEEIEQIRTTLRDVLIPGIAAQIPDVRFAAGHFADFPVSTYGSMGDEVFRILVDTTTDLDTVQRGIDALALQGGNDGPEAAIEALYLSATGTSLLPFVPERRCIDRTTIGYPCFRPNAAPVVLLFTDAPFHNGPFGSNSYVGISPRPHTYSETIGALRAIGARVLGLYSGASDVGGLPDIRALVRDTGAVRADGTPLVFEVGTDGAALGASVIEAIRTLVEEVPNDIDVVLEDGPDDDLDALLFVERVEALSANPVGGATRLADRFADVMPGTEVTFRIHLRNELIERLATPQRYRLQVILRGDGVTPLRTTFVEVVIPSIDGEGCAP